MPFTDQQIETLRATDPAIVKEMMGRLSDQQRSELFAAVSDYDTRKAGGAAPKPEQPQQPGGEPQDWQKNLQPFTLANGAQTLVRQDNAAYLDAAQTGDQAGYQGPGWYQWDQQSGAWKRTTDAPDKKWWQKAGDIPVSPLGALASLATGEPTGPTPASIGQGALQTYQGIVQNLMHNPPSHPLAAPGVEPVREGQQEAAGMVDAAISRERQAYERNFTPSTTGEMTGSALALPMPPIGAPATLAGRIASGAATGGILSGLTSPVQGAEKMTLDQYAEQKAGQIGMGAATGGAIPAVGGAVSRIAKGLTNKAPLPSSVVESEALGIPVMTSDVKPPTTFAGKWLQTMGEKVPIVGTGGPRRAQQVKRVDAIRDLLTEFGASDVASASDDVMADLAKKRSSDLTKYSGMKAGVIEKLGKRGTVRVDRTTAEIDNQIAKLDEMNTKEVQPIIDRLNDWKAAIIGYRDGTVNGQNLENIEMLREQIGKSFDSPDLATVRDRAQKALNAIYKPLKEDMGDFIKAAGDRTDYTKWAVANKRLAESMGELKSSALKSVLKRGDATPEAVQSMLFSAKPSEVRLLYKNLTPEGRASAEMAILAKAAKDAGGIENVSPEKFISSVNKLGSPMGVFFTGDKGNRVKGLIRALKLTEHASRASLNPPTGVQAVPLVAGIFGALLGGVKGTVALAGGIGGTARAYESKSVRDILLKLPKTRPGSQEEMMLYNRLNMSLQTAANNEPQEQE